MRRYATWDALQLSAQEQEMARKMEKELGISKALAEILIKRGVKRPEEARCFLEPSIKRLSSPFSIPGMVKAVDRLEKAVREGERITIYGDYDADGVLGTVMLLESLSQLTPRVDYYIPDRFEEGYGLNETAIQNLKLRGTDLLVTVDCGVTSVKEAEMACSLDMDLIITDHHEPGPLLPRAEAVINPKLNPEKTVGDLCGAGVVFYLLRALSTRFPSLNPEGYLEMVALATVADVVPLLRDNRILVAEGLKKLENTKHLGLRALIRASQVGDKELTPWHVGFILAPRINAAGRMGETDTAIRLFLAQDPEEAASLAARLGELNRKRQEIEARVLEEALGEVERHKTDQMQAIILGKEGWHLGVLGIVASRLAEMFRKPTFLLSWEGEVGRGSGRSIEGFDLFGALLSCRDCLIKFGGHSLAAGISIEKKRFDEFCRKFERVAEASRQMGQEKAQVLADLEISLDEVSLKMAKELKKLEPFGEGNPRPLVLIRKVEIGDINTVGKNKEHLRFIALEEKVRVSVIGFNSAGIGEQISDRQLYDLLCEVSVDGYGGEENVQLLLKDIKTSDTLDDVNPFVFGMGKTEPSDNVFRGVEEAIKVILVRNEPAVLVYPTVRCLEKHRLAMVNVFPSRFLIKVHGRMPSEARTQGLDMLRKKECRVFLTTESFFKYYIINLGINLACLFFWGDEGLVRECPQVVKAVKSVTLPVDVYEKNTADFPDKIGKKGQLIYTNRKRTLESIREGAQGLVEAGLTRLAERVRVRRDYVKGKAQCLIWDGVFGGGLPRVPGHELVFADAPFGRYEVDSILAQTWLVDSPCLRMAFDQGGVQENIDYLKAVYPDADEVKGFLARVADWARKGQDVVNIKVSQNAPGAWKEMLKTWALLQITKDLGRCEFRGQSGLFQVYPKAGSNEISLKSSPYYLEGLAEHRAFTDFLAEFGPF